MQKPNNDVDNKIIVQRGLLITSCAFFLFSVFVSFASTTQICPVDNYLKNIFGKSLWEQCAEGNNGKQGTQGLAGLNGKNGLDGNSGTNGSDGKGGERGTNGLDGLKGEKGLTGTTGLQGLTGTQGTPGLNGLNGADGATGAQGIQGLQGFQGLQGIIGLTGAQGLQGIPGTNGIDGAIGATGLQGLQGIIGLTGAQGIQGIQGTPGVLSVTNDTNISGSLTGSNLTLGWSGVLSTTRGGTGLSTIGTAGQLLRVNSSGTGLEYFNLNIPPASVIDANNGLSLVGGIVQLGGNLFQPTVVDGGGNDLAFISNNRLSLGGNGIDIGNNSNSFSGNPNQIAIGQNNSLLSDNQTVLGSDNRLTGSNNFLIGSAQDFSNIDPGSNALYSIGSRNDSNTGALLNDVYLFGNRNNLSNSIAYQDTYIFGGSNDIQGSESLTLGNRNTVNSRSSQVYTLGNNNVNDGRNLFLIGQNLNSTDSGQIQLGFSDSTKTIFDNTGRLTLQGSLNVNGSDGNPGDVLSSTGAGGIPQWIAAFGIGNVNVGNGLTNNGSSIFINSPTCTGTQKLSWNGTSFTCSADLNNIYTAGAGIAVSGGNVISNTGLLSIATATGSTGLALTPTTTSGAVSQVLSGTLAIANGGTGSATQNFVDLTTAQSIAGNKTFTSNLAQTGTGTFSTGTGTVSINGPTSLASSLTQSGITAPSLSGAGQGRIYFDSTSNVFRVSQNGSAYANLLGSSSAFSGLTAATATNTIDNANFAQTWNWSTATTQNPLTLSGTALTTGSLLSLTSGTYTTGGAAINISQTGGAGILSNTPGIDLTTPTDNTLNVVSGTGTLAAATFDSGSTGAVNIGTNTNAKTITLGNSTGATSLVLNNGTGAINIGTSTTTGVINIGTGASARTTTIGNVTGATGLVLNSGTGGLQFATTGTVSIGSGANTGAISLGGGTGTRTINIGNSTSAQTINIGTTTAGTITLGTAVGNQVIIPGIGNAAVSANTVCYTAGNALGSCTSARRFKHNISSLPENQGLDFVNKLQPVYFDFNGSNEKSQGFIAEDIAKINDRLVFRNSNGQIQGLNYQLVTANLAKAIQQQQSQINSFSADSNQVAALKSVTDSLDSRVTKLEGDIKNLKSQLASNPVSSAPTTPIENLDKAISDYFAKSSSLYLPVTGGTIAKLEVSGSLLVKGGLKVNGSLEIDGVLVVGNNTAGEVVIGAGKTKVRISFSPALKNTPIVAVTPIDSEAKFKVTNKSKTGFDIVLTDIEATETNFDWIVVTK